MARPRTKKNKKFPPHLLVRPRHGVDYYFWRDPRNGKECSLRCNNDEALAIRRTRELNSVVTRELAEAIVRDIAAATVPREMPFDAWAIDCLGQWQKAGLAINTLKSRKSLLNAAVKKFKQRPISGITVRDVAALMQEYINADKGRSAKAMRSMLIDVFRLAREQGHIAHDAPNPAEITRNPEVSVKRARLLLEDFIAIRPELSRLSDRLGGWVENSTLLALISGQRREDISRIQFRRGADWQAMWLDYQDDPKRNPSPYPFIEDDMLWLVQGKTGALVRIPLSLRLEILGMSLADIVDRCRASGVVSRYLVHHDRPFGNAPVGSPIHIDNISRQFSVARDATGRSWGKKNPPTFHELRSLSERLYKEQGLDTQTLLGHTSSEMTQVYDDLRQADWRTVKVS